MDFTDLGPAMSQSALERAAQEILRRQKIMARALYLVAFDPAGCSAEEREYLKAQLLGMSK